ncbi:MAG: sulfite exporter TauE/SafE family protein [Cytophagaceae bacterium]|nr:sulfite exporter TauE/SafE family protein [Cytophagaceae bacterium]
MSKVLSVSLHTEKKILSEESDDSKIERKKWTIYLSIVIILLIALLFLFIHFGKNPFHNLPSFAESFLQEEILIFILVGFVAQMIDGALGMAYGVSSTSMMLSAGVSPELASAGVHTAEVFTSGASGLSHLFHGNVNKKLFKNLIIPGTIGAVLGAYVLTSIDGNAIKPFVSAYLLFMGMLIIKKAFNKIKKKTKTKRLAPLALVGGFVDSVGGGGWGPVVSSTLIGKGRNPKYTIGSVNLAEFFVAVASASVFTIILGFQNWKIVLGLIIGGVIAAPLAAIIVGRIKTKPLMIIVGCLIIGLSLNTIISAILK